MNIHNLVKSFFTDFEDFLHQNYPGITVRRLEDELDYYLLKMNFSDIQEAVNLFFEKVECGIPLSYITGAAWFYKSRFFVDKTVLIPRFETELLVEMAILELERWRGNIEKKIKICDVGTGSGAIILSILRDCEMPLDAYATDISWPSIGIAKKNYFNLGFVIPKSSRLTFKITDRLYGISERQHVIVTNPPYIKVNSDMDMVHKQVARFEPEEALFLDDLDYEDWFKLFFEQAFKTLYDGGVMLMEGHENHLDQLSKVAKKTGFSDVIIKKDYTKRDRFMIARKD